MACVFTKTPCKYVSLSFQTKAKLLWEFDFVLEGQMHSEQSSKSAEFSGHNMKSERKKQLVLCKDNC